MTVLKLDKNMDLLDCVSLASRGIPLSGEKLRNEVKMIEKQIVTLGGDLDYVRRYRDDMDESELKYTLTLRLMQRDLLQSNYPLAKEK